MTDFLRQSVSGGNRDWLFDQLKHVAKQMDNVEVAAPVEFKTAVTEMKRPVIEMQYLLFVALVSMKSVRAAAGITDSQIEFARLRVEGYTRGTTGEAADIHVLMFLLRCHYLHL